ncbi:hypothetical protein D9M68_359750 [compost metagenome]
MGGGPARNLFRFRQMRIQGQRIPLRRGPIEWRRMQAGHHPGQSIQQLTDGYFGSCPLLFDPLQA